MAVSPRVKRLIEAARPALEDLRYVKETVREYLQDDFDERAAVAAISLRVTNEKIDGLEAALSAFGEQV